MRVRKQAAVADRSSAVRHSLSQAVQIALAASLGLLLVWGVAFAPIAALHNAAHDVRHSDAFPCH